MTLFPTFRARLVLCLVFALVSFGSSAQTPSSIPRPGVLLRSVQGAYILPKKVIPTVHFKEMTAEKFASLLEEKILGDIQWAEPGMRYRVTCSEAAKNRRFSFGEEKDVPALGLLMEFALASGTVVTVDDLKITIDLPQ